VTSESYNDNNKK